MCNGHAEACDKQDQFKRVCECQHNTCGDNCETCCEPFVQKKWRKATEDNPNECERELILCFIVFVTHYNDKDLSDTW